LGPSYGRERGFEGEEDQVHNDDRALKVLQEMQAVTCFPKSHRQRVQMFGAFECSVLKAHPNLPYAEFLKSIAHTTNAGPSVEFQVPPQVVMDSYILHLHGIDIRDGIPGRLNKYNAIGTRVGMISGTFMEFGIEGGLVKSSNAITLLKQYKEEDKMIHTKVLELGWDLPAMCRTLFQWSFSEMTKSALLFGHVYCPISESSGKHCA
jgi:hypothetical protein